MRAGPASVAQITKSARAVPWRPCDERPEFTRPPPNGYQTSIHGSYYRLAALILFQAERLGERRLVPAPTPIEPQVKLA